jgi:uncharacterized protein YpmB
MSVRIRIIIVIILATLFIILFSAFSGITYAKKNMEKTIEADMTAVADIADHFVSDELELLRMQASEVVYYLSTREKSLWSGALEVLETVYPQFPGMAIFDRNGTAAAGGKFN